MEWNETTIAQLRVYWAEGLSTNEIGRRMGFSKNAVVGKAHRLNLPARPSPIKRDGVRNPRRRLVRRVMGPTLAPLQTLGDGAPPPPAAVAQTVRPMLMLRRCHVPVPGGRIEQCAWPIGEPGTKSFRFCDADAVAGRPYCTEHASLAYVGKRRVAIEPGSAEWEAVAARMQAAADLRHAEMLAGVRSL